MTKLFFKDKPLIGLDISSTDMKIMSVDIHKKSVSGYGVIDLDPLFDRLLLHMRAVAIPIGHSIRAADLDMPAIARYAHAAPSLGAPEPLRYPLDHLV